jgi:hypothetical protein
MADGPAPAAATPHPVPAPAPVQAAYPAPAPAPVAAPRLRPAPAPVQAEELPEEDAAERPARPARTRPAAQPGGVPKALLYGVAAYALLMTVLAVYGLAFRSPSLPPDHPLSIIPDTFGEFDAANRKKVSMGRVKLDGELPANLRAALGGKIEVGQVTVEPVGVERRRLEVFAEGKNEKARQLASPGDGLVLKLKVTNTSQDLAFCPLDPAFNRRTVTDDKPATRVVVEGEVFAGGPIEWPFPTGTRRYEKDQQSDNTPLRPGETREYAVCSSTSPSLARAVKNAKDPVLWRVQIRRGLYDYNGREIPVTAVVGVEFRGDQVEGL